MQIIYDYTVQFIIGLIHYLPIVLILRIVFIFIIRKRYRFNIYHEVGILVFAIYLLSLFNQTFDLNKMYDFNYKFIGGFNIVPFKQILLMLNNQNRGVAVLNLIGNVLIFLPIGLIVPTLWKNQRTLVNTIVVGFLISLFIEMVQMVLPRATDIDDLILNTTGVVIGFLVYKVIYRYFDNFIDKFLN